VIPIVAGYSLRNLLRGELAVIFRVQDIGYGIRICGHRFNNSFLSENCINVAEREKAPVHYSQGEDTPPRLSEGRLWSLGGKSLLRSEERPLNSNAYRKYTPIPAQ
jgi:hypothetical protein